MPILAQIAGSFRLTADSRPSVPVRVTVEDPDAFYIDLTITERAAVAHAERASALGVGLSYEFEPDVWVPFPDCEIGRVFNIEETTDQFGDVLTFELMGEQWSPFIRDLFRQRTGFRAELVYGSPANEYRKQVFEGVVVDHSFIGTPPHVQVKCLDAAGLYARRLAKDWILPANSGRSRLSIGYELLAIGGIPYGTLDLGDNGGGIINKPYAIGDTPIVVWLRDFWRVIGVEVAFIEGKFTAWRYNPHQQPVMEITEADAIPPDEYHAPATLEPNVLGAVSVGVTYTEALSSDTIETGSVVIAPYARQSAAFIQVTTGALIPQDVVLMEISQIIGRTKTRVTRQGGVETRFEQTDEAIYAPAAARFAMHASNPASSWDEEFEQQPRTGAEVYIYPDGSTRRDREERLRTIQKVIRTKTLNSRGEVVSVTEQRFRYRRNRQKLFDVNVDSGGMLHDHPIGSIGMPYMDDGQGGDEERIGSISEWIDGVYFSTYPDEIASTEFVIAADGTLSGETTVESSYDRGAPLARSAGRFGFGIDVNQRTYHSRPADTSDVNAFTFSRVTTKTYRAIDEDRYGVSSITRENGIMTELRPDDIFAGSLPRPERTQLQSAAQEIRAIVEDDYRIALANDERIEYIEHNEFLQNQAEAEFYARYLAWLKSAITLPVTVPIEAQAHKLKPVTVNFPATGGAKKFVVTGVRRDAVTFSEALTLEYRSPWLA